MRIFDSRIVWIRSFFHMKPKALRQYRCSHHFFLLCALPNVAAVTIFSDATLKDNLSPKLPKSFQPCFFALEFSLNQFFANKPTEPPCVWYIISSSTWNLAKFIWILKNVPTFLSRLISNRSKILPPHCKELNSIEQIY